MNTGKIRLCIVNPYLSGGGAEYQIRCWIQSLLLTNRFEIFYLAHHVDGGGEQMGFKVIRIGSGPMPFLGYLRDAVPLYRALRRINPHVIYQRVACGYTGICAFYARHHAARMIWHVAHDSDVTRDALDGGRNFARRFLEKKGVEYGIRNTDHIVVQTEHQAQLLEKNYGRRASRVIPNFHPQPTEPSHKSAQVSVLWIANLKPWKNPEVFVCLARRLRDMPQAKFVMIGAPASGSGDREWAENLARQIKQTSNLEYLGQKTHEEVNELLAAAHIFVNTSLQEGFPNTFIQAWMRNVAVVSLHVDPDSVLQKAQMGVLAGSEDDLEGKMRELISRPELRTQYTARALKHACIKHSMHNAAMLTQLIDEAV